MYICSIKHRKDYGKRLEAVGRLLDIMDELREKCPWDREATFDSVAG